MAFSDAVQSQNQLVEEIGFDSAYLTMAIAVILDEPDVNELASAGLTDGGGDRCIDFIYFDEDARKIIFAQGYYTEKKSDSAPAKKASDLNTAAAWIVSGNTAHVPEKLRDIIETCRTAIADKDVDSIDLAYVHNLPESINVARELQTAEEQLRKALADESIIIRAYELGKHRLDELYAARDSHIEVKEDVKFPGAMGVKQIGPTWKGSVSTVSGKWIYDLFHRYGDKLYSANYRGFLGASRRRRVNSGIRESAEKAPSDFWAFNNGITLLTLGVAEARDGATLKGVSVINGAQTTGSIGSVDPARTDLENVKVLCRVIECSDQNTIDQIVRFNNTQNVITTWDQFSNDTDQKRIAAEFEEIGFSYTRKRGFVADGEQIGIEQVLQPLIAYHGRPADAVRGRNQLFTNKQLYDSAFSEKKARHILFVYTLARAIDTKRLELKKKSDEQKLIAVEDLQLRLLRNLNFKPFLISVIAHSLETIVGKPCDLLTTAFSPDAAKGASVAALAARWLPVVETFLPLLTSIVKVDEFFRNLSKDDGYIQSIKLQMDAMLAATGAAEKNASFAALVSEG
jgi:hypothetical protein